MLLLCGWTAGTRCKGYNTHYDEYRDEYGPEYNIGNAEWSRGGEISFEGADFSPRTRRCFQYEMVEAGVNTRTHSAERVSEEGVNK